MANEYNLFEDPEEEKLAAQELLTTGIPTNPEEALQQAMAQDPSVIEARGERDARLAQAGIVQGATEIATALASQGRVRPNTKVFDAIREAADLKAKEAQQDVGSKNKTVSEYIKAKAAAEKAAEAEDWKKLNYEQRERAIKAMEGERAANRQDKEDAKNKPTDTNIQAAGFGKRLEDAERVFGELESSGYNRASPGAAIESNLADLPFGLGDIAQATVQSGNSKKQDQAERNFVNAVLRRESGAAISKQEFDNAEKQYFPRVGDTPEVKAQKAANRKQILETLKVASGPAWAKVPLVTGGTAKPKISPQEARKELERRKMLNLTTERQ